MIDAIILTQICWKSAQKPFSWVAAVLWEVEQGFWGRPTIKRNQTSRIESRLPEIELKMDTKI